LEKPKSTTNKAKLKKSYHNCSLTINQFSYLENKIQKMKEETESIKKNVLNIDYSYFM